MTTSNKWYIINVLAGHEAKIMSEIKSMIVRGVFHGHVEDVIIPAKQVLKVKRGKKVEESQKLFPGYVFVNANLEGDVFSIISSIPKVIGFLGPKNRPEAVPQQKIDEILALSQAKSGEKEFSFDVGEIVSITDGPFESFSGTVDEFDPEKKKVKISVMIFGRATSVELNLDQVEKK